MATSWTYSDWVTLTTAAAKLARLRLHIQEVSDVLAGEANYSVPGLAIGRNLFDTRLYLEGLRKDEAALDAQAGERAGWTSGRAQLW